MRLIYIIFLVCCLGTVLLFALSDYASRSAGTAALVFAGALRGDNLAQALAFFGDNTCSCPPKGGYLSYLIYQSGQAPNLTFMRGAAFDIGKATVLQAKEKAPYTLPWEQPQGAQVSLPVAFRQAGERPFYLPLATAFGKPISSEDFEKFLVNPGADHGAGFSLRLRPKLDAGFIPLPPAAAGDVQSTRDMAAVDYLVPRDPGSIASPSGKVMTTLELKARLPRIHSLILHLKMERRGVFNPWHVARFSFTDGIVSQPGGRLTPLGNGGRD